MFQNRILKILCAVSLLMFFSIGQASASSGNPAGSNSASLAGQEELVQKVKESYLASKPGIDTALIFASDISQENPWGFGIVGNQASAIQQEPSLVYFIAKNQENGWKVALEQTDLFAIWLDIAPNSLINDEIKGILKIRSLNNPVTPYGLGLPWATGQSWTLIKGPNSASGETWSSMDFQGPNQAELVRSAKEGLVTISSACPNFVLVSHSGFKTGYYHLTNIAVENNQMIERGTVLGETSTQAGCGGFASEPLVHFSIRNSNGTPIPVSGFDIGGWNIIKDAGTNKGCLKRANDELKICSGESLFNDGTIENGPRNSNLQLASFTKQSPADGATNQPVDVTLYWNAASNVTKYKYCYYSEGIPDVCDPNNKATWIDADSSTATHAKLSGLAAGKTYHWQVGAKLGDGTFIFADDGWWSFQTKSMTPITISGNAGVTGATLSYTDVTAKTATADSGSNYSFTVSYNWSGTVTPSKAGYLFAPVNRTYTTIQVNQTAQNYTATPITYTISGNAGVAGATLSYTDVTSKTSTADGSGNYSFTVPYNWSGTVTPSKTGYAFTPVNMTYTNVSANQTAKNYTALVSISGNAGAAGATLSYTDVTAKTATAGASGNYSFTVPYNWSGTVTPSKAGSLFTPVNYTYTNVQVNQTSQNFSAIAGVIISGNVGLFGVNLSYIDGTPKIATADGYGNYLFTVPFNWSGAVTPFLGGFIFTPINRTYTVVVANQTGQNYTIDNLHQMFLPLIMR